MRVSVSRAVVLLLLIPFASPASREVHRGWYRAGCGNASFHIPNVKELDGEELVFTIGGGFPGPPWAAYVNSKEWAKAPAERCTSDSKCVPLKAAKIWFENVRGEFKKVSGKYGFEIESQCVEGNFVAQDKTSPDLRCE